MRRRQMSRGVGMMGTERIVRAVSKVDKTVKICFLPCLRVKQIDLHQPSRLWTVCFCFFDTLRM